MKKIILIVMALMLATTMAYAGQCIIGCGETWFNGNTKVVMGVLLKQMQCPAGHTSWERY
jgi:hypothetical protein